MYVRLLYRKHKPKRKGLASSSISRHYSSIFEMLTVISSMAFMKMSETLQKPAQLSGSVLEK